MVQRNIAGLHPLHDSRNWHDWRRNRPRHGAGLSGVQRNKGLVHFGPGFAGAEGQLGHVPGVEVVNASEFGKLEGQEGNFKDHFW